MLLTAVSIYCDLIKYWVKQKHLLPFHVKNNNLREVMYKQCKSKINVLRMQIKISNKCKDISVKNHTYYFFDDIINIKIFVPNNILIDQKSYKDILIRYIGYAIIKDPKYTKINSANPLYLILSKVNEYFEEIDKNKYVTLIPTNESKEIIKIWRTKEI